jgi:hypothetical protein
MGLRTVFFALRLARGFTRYGYRFLSGRPMDGSRRTDATFFRPATRSLDPSGTALRWEMMRGASRAAIRVSVSYLLLLLLVLLLLFSASHLFGFSAPGEIAETLLSFHLLIISVSFSVIFTHRGSVEYGVRLPALRREEVLREKGDQEVEKKVLRLRWYERPGRRAWELEKVLPLAQALSTMLNLGTMTRKKARRVVFIPRDFREPGRTIEILLPPTFTGADGKLDKRIVSTVQRRLGFKEEMSARWELEGASPRVLLTMPLAPPREVSFYDVEKALLAAEEFSPVVGVIGGGETMTISAKSDSPHAGISAGSGAGKSVLIKFIAMQYMRWGWNLVVLDWKEESHEWAKGLPGVRYCSSVEQIHDMYVLLGEEVDDRKSSPGVERPKIMVISEEMNITAPLLADYWSTLRATAEPEERKVMPLRSPAMTGAMKINFTGRQLMILNLFVAQRFSARVTNGNADLRESFQVMFMARWKEQTRKMLAGGIKPFPKMPKEVGRWVVIVGEETMVVQVPLVSDEEAREFATGGIAPAHSPFILRSGPTAPHGGDVDREQENLLGGRLTAPHELPSEPERPVELRKLSNMVEGLSHLGITHDILKHAAKDSRHNFPPVLGGSPQAGYLYDFYAVAEWAKKRNASRAAERNARS